ncbi:hypothetical protein GE061_001035 [Apolygus lucorum]|uniref:GPI ethanolamine phosphate transferase 1 n=1 Tax=Apolygus lucorum TaxID=248454 RepID=A0A8S9Y7I0_APOLU|nr:hypothetical protein GE061_001035 [Apolygus lucorum]
MNNSLMTWVIIVHCILLLGMFDVYFKSPIVPGLPTVGSTYKTPAKRLVLFLGDGLRIDHVYQTCNVPFLRYLVESGRAITGISHTRVPTESRPGTVALAAGVYEDPSAVFKGWQDNPVPVDSFFNRCRQSFAWGSPDIVHLFSRNATNIDARSYKEEDQSFDPHESLKLNQWVLAEFENFIEDCKHNSTCRNILNRDKISFFFHFIGIDMAGHKSKPFSESYNKHIQLTDDIIQQIVQIFNDYFKDQSTAYVFTSDHGMTDWGSHGAGSDEETKTPLIVWGSGVKNAEETDKTDDFAFLKNTSECSWTFNLDKKFDVEQADIAVLMSTLLGVDIPTNNMGTLPWRYLDFKTDTLLSAMLLNLHQLLILYHHLESITKKQVMSPFFRPFPSPDIEQIPLAYAGVATDVVKFVQSVVKGDPENLVQVISEHIMLVKEGINYYQTYFQSYLLFLLCTSFVGLILIIAGKIYLRSTSPVWIEEERQKRRILYYIHNIKVTAIEQFFVVLFLIITGVHLTQTLPISYYIYAVLPVILWYKAIDFWSLTAIVVQLKSVKWTQALAMSFFLVIGVELLYLSFFHRWLLSVGMVALSAFPFTIRRNRNFRIAPAVVWTVSCLALSVFPLLPTVGVAKQTFLVISSGLLWLIIISVAVNVTMDAPIGGQIFSNLTRIQVVLINAAIASVIFVDVFAAHNSVFRLPGRIFSWAVLVLDFGVLLLLPDSPSARMFNLILAFGIPFLMLSTSFESLFFPILTANMVSWILLEKSTSISDRRILFNHTVMSYLHSDEIRRGFFFLFFILFSFFGIGNIDSVNSFDINWVRCFIDVFSPFTMTTLIVLKTVMPFFLVACALRLIVIHTRVDGVKILLISMVMCEIMNMLFLFMVKNSGSWLDIGKSISHYVIMEVSSLCLVLLYNAAGYILLPLGVPDVI